MLLMTSIRKDLPALALPIPPTRRTSVTPPWTLVNSRDSIVRRRNHTVAAIAASVPARPPWNPGCIQSAVAAVDDHQNAPALASRSVIATASQVHAMVNIRTGLGFA